MSLLVPELNSTNEELRERLQDELLFLSSVEQSDLNILLGNEISNFFSMKNGQSEFELFEFRFEPADKMFVVSDLRYTFLQNVVAQRLEKLLKHQIDDLTERSNCYHQVLSLCYEAVDIRDGKESECSGDLKSWLKDNKIDLDLKVEKSKTSALALAYTYVVVKSHQLALTNTPQDLNTEGTNRNNRNPGICITH